MGEGARSGNRPYREALVREIVQVELEDAGYDVIIADSADAAIAILETSTDINLVFTDIDMPGSMDGLKLAACVRDRWPPVHIIITTGKARPREIPANALFIPKPYVGQAVVDAIQTFEKCKSTGPVQIVRRSLAALHPVQARSNLGVPSKSLPATAQPAGMAF
jgi:two-component system, response regulator PdtaR